MGTIETWLETAQPPAGWPLVTLCYTQSLDGSIALRRGRALALSGELSLKLTHSLRASHDAILVGIGTVLSDDPQLNVRLVSGSDPRIVVLDSKLRLPDSAKILKSKGAPIVFCTDQAGPVDEHRLVSAGAIVERQVGNASDQVDLSKMLSRLEQLGIRRLMVEGGGEVISSFLAGGWVGRAVITISPCFIGGYKAADQVISREPFTRLRKVKSEFYGDDLVIWGEVTRP